LSDEVEVAPLTSSRAIVMKADKELEWLTKKKSHEDVYFLWPAMSTIVEKKLPVSYIYVDVLRT
jgi:hypothetical protein